jgi:hypothetical protein
VVFSSIQGDCGFRGVTESDEHITAIWPMIPTKKECRVKEKTNAPSLTTSNDDMDLLDDEESPLIMDGSPPPASMDINMVFTLSTVFRVVDEEIAQLCLGPKEAVFEKPEKWSQHSKPLYV